MSFKRGDVITFADDDKVLVFEALLHDGVEYLYVNEILADESDLTDSYKILYANYEDGTLVEVEDKEVLKVITPIFLEKLAEYAE